MSLHVQRQVIRSAERSQAMQARERFLAGVFPVVSRQFVRSGEFPGTSGPRALVRFLTYNYYQQISKLLINQTIFSPHLYVFACALLDVSFSCKPCDNLPRHICGLSFFSRLTCWGVRFLCGCCYCCCCLLVIWCPISCKI